MKILIIVLCIIGLLKLVSLFIVCIIEIYHRIVKVDINGVTRQCGFYKYDIWYIIPTITISRTSKYFEIMVNWLCFRYYTSYNIDKDDEE